MRDVLFQNYQHLQYSHLREYAESIELDLKGYDADMNDHIYLQGVQEHLASGRKSSVKTTPAFFVNNKLVNTDDGLDNLFAAVKSEIAQSHKMQKR